MDVFKITLWWFGAVMVALVGSLVFLEVGMSYFPFIWVAVGLIIAYKARYQSAEKLSPPFKIAAILFGLVASFYALSISYFRMPEATILLAGLSIIFFTILNLRRPIVPLLIPVAVALASRFIRPMMESLITPLVQLTFIIVSVIFGLFVEVKTRGVILSFTAVNGALMNIGIDNSCSGIWSLSAFTLAMLLVLIVFPNLFRRWLQYFVVGFVVTYVINIIRIIFVCFVGYFTGSYEQVMFTHTHVGWILFTLWMIVFWYSFISEFLRERKKT